MDFLIFLRARGGRSAQGFKDWYVDRFAGRALELSPGLRRHVANLAVEGPAELRPPQYDPDPQARYDVVASLALDDGAGFRAILEDAALADWADVRNGYRVSDTLVIDREPSRATALPGYKIIREILFHADMPDSAARRSWTHHGSLAKKVHVGVTRYVQHWVEERIGPNPHPVRGISDLYLPDWETMLQRYYDSPRGREEVSHDAGHFIESQLPRVYAQEHVLTA
jgi:hypothetical protein